MVKIVVFGLDGATFEVINKELDRLPNLKRLIKESAHGILESTIPMETVVAWNAFATGKNPGKLGVYDFMMKKSGQKEFHVIDFSKLSFDYFWKYLDGRKIGIASIPAIPFQEVNGFFIQGSFIMVSTTTKAVVEGENCSLPSHYDHHINWEEGEEKMLEDLKKITKARISFFKYLVKRCKPDLSILIFNSTDHVQHHFWGYWDESHPLHRESQYGEAIPEIYRQIDRGIGEILSLFKEEPYVIIISDHGFGPCHSTFYINNWLSREKYLTYKRKKESLLYSLVKKAYHIAGRMGLLNFIENVKRKTLERYFPRVFDFIIKERENVIDWSKTSAYSIGYFGQIYINTNEGDNPEKYEQVREEIIRKLEELKDPERCEKIIEKVLRKEEVYYGPYLDGAPDLLVVPSRGYEICSDLQASTMLTRKIRMVPNSGTHRPEGIFIAYGPSIRKRSEISKAKIYDIAPTILHMFNISIPPDMDGRVLLEIFDEWSEPYRRKIKYREVVSKKEKEPEFLIEGEEIIRERLRKLGYID